MNKRSFITLTLTSLMIIAIMVSCSSNRNPGRVYMPDMMYSRAYETYANNNLQQEGINYVNYPVEGTIRRGDLFPYTNTNDSVGYKASADVKSPITSMTPVEMTEAQRLFNVNCAICHGPKMDAQGPLATSGKVGGIANLTLPQYVALPEGTMFHSVTYGKGNMGSYASQLNRKQRWMVIRYVKSEQTKASTPTAASTDSSAATAAKTAGAVPGTTSAKMANGNDATKGAMAKGNGAASGNDSTTKKSK